MSSDLEDIKTIDLEEWLTLATAPSSTKLKQGQSPDMQNVWVDEKPGSIITAPGFVKVGTIPSGNPVTFCIDYFNTSAGTQTFVVSDNSTVWTTVDFQVFTAIITGLSSSFQLRGVVIRDKLWLTNGSDAVQVFDGSSISVLDGSTTPTLVIQDITYKIATTNYSPSQVTIAYTTGGTAGSEVVSVTNSTQISVQIQTGVSTATQVLAAINASAAALILVSATVTGTGSHAQTAPVSATSFPNAVPNAPRGRYIAYHDERVWLYHVSSSRSAVYFSALSDDAANIIVPDDYSAWDTVDNFLQISEGDADFGTGMVLYRGYLHFFKQYSIWRLVGYDEYTYSRVKTRSSTGTRFNESVQILDSLIHLIGVDGIYEFDGEESDRISDIIDPATASQTAFGFNQLQQPNTNNQFWEVSDTADWNSGVVPTNVSISDSISLAPSDDSQVDFQAGPTQTNVDLVDNPGFLQLAVSTIGQSSTNLAFNQIATVALSGGVSLIGQPSFMTDGNFTNNVGNSGAPAGGTWSIPISKPVPLTTVILKGLIPGSINPNGGPSVTIFFNFTLGGNPVTFQMVSVSGVGAIAALADRAVIFDNNSTTPHDITVTFEADTSGAGFIADTMTMRIVAYTGLVMTECQIFSCAYATTGKFTSKTLDLGTVPVSLGTFSSNEVLNGETTAYFTQSSDDGISWDAETSVTNGGSIASTPRRYLRWGVNLTSDGLNTPQIDAAYLPTVYQSAVHDTGGNIFAWGPLESDRFLAAQTINYYYRGSSTSGGVSLSAWSLIVPGGVLVLPTNNRYVQFKIEISGGSATNLPLVNSVTINWVVGTAGQPQTLQNVASAYWRNRYWLSAAGPGSSANNTILIRGKKTFESPWMLKDWPLLSFTRYFDSLYGGSSVDGSIYQLDTGYSKAGIALDSYFETGDFTFGGFTAQFIELIVEAERSGSWVLNIGVSIDGGNTWDTYTMDLTQNTPDPNYMKRINVSYTVTKIRFRFSTNGIDTPFQVHRCLAFYQLSPERGSIKGDYN
jgi:hypothetical protein